MLIPRRAPVRPRVHLPESGEALPLEDEVRELAESGATGLVRVVGQPGAGKTSALSHLAAVLGDDDRVLLLDDPAPCPPFAPAERLVVFTTSVARDEPPRACYELAPWGREDLIEYLLATHRPICASVLARLTAADYQLFGGRPQLWQVVLEQLAADPALPDGRAAFQGFLAAGLADTDLLERTRSVCLNLLTSPDADALSTAGRLIQAGVGRDLARVLRHRAAQLLVVTERVAADLRGEGACDYLASRLPRDLVRAVAQAVAGDARAPARLHQLLDGPPWPHAMAASLLHLLEPGWDPEAGRVPILAGAYLQGAAWAGARLAGADLRKADLSDADFHGADLHDADASEADLSGARLSCAALNGFRAKGANLAGARLAAACGERACFDDANLARAEVEDAALAGASFKGANLRDAVLAGADLSRGTFAAAEIEGADFSGANLGAAKLSDLRLRAATFRGACFAAAELRRCDLEGMDLGAADFHQADLQGALLTGALMAGADLRDACLCEAALGDVNWEGVRLCGADLRRATFQMGSSRSGLLITPIASEGTRTGFYTDDSEEQYFKAPEEIRKANLCGADLRGARIDEVDFYLVDLRGARYDQDQAEHFRRCRAILGAPG
jgi:uncharacterized protein YjbI with pentapeptide repeats